MCYEYVHSSYKLQFYFKTLSERGYMIYKRTKYNKTNEINGKPNNQRNMEKRSPHEIITRRTILVTKSDGTKT